MATLQSHTWTFEVSTSCCCFVICPRFWDNCVPKIHLTRAIFSRLGDCFGTPLLWRFLLVSIHNYDWQIFWGWNCRIGIVTDWVFSVLVFLLFAFFCRICWTHLVNEDSKIVVKYSSETAQINQSFCIKQKQSCFCHAWEPESGIYIWSELSLSFIHHFWSVFITSFWLGQIYCVSGSACISYRFMCFRFG